MTPDEDQCLQLASATVSVALKLWVGPLEPIAAAAADIVKGKIQTSLDRRRFERFVSSCEDLVTKRIINYVKHSEYGVLPENEVTAAIAAMTETIDAADYRSFARNPRDLGGNDFGALALTYDLDATRIERHLRADAERRNVLQRAALSEGADSLYRLLMRETCNTIIDVYQKLPKFPADAMTELLKRHTIIAAELEKLLERIPARRSAKDFESDYRRAVINRLDTTEIFGVTGANRRYPLSVAYISLSASTSRYDPTAPDTTPDSVEAVLAGRQRALVIGGAGSGKTTLLQWLAVRCAQRDLPESFTKAAEPEVFRYPAECVPFLIPLRRYATRPLPPPEQFVAAVAPEIAEEAPAQWVHAILRDGRGVVLVDGLDEVSEGSERRAALEWMEGLMAAFPRCVYVITSRPLAADVPRLEQNRVEVCELLTMSSRAVREFIRRWHLAARESLPLGKDELARDEAALVASIDADRHLRLLAVNPLLCALLCTLSSQRRGRLPRQKVEVYTAALDMLLGRRDLERGISSQVEIPVQDQVFILQNLAFWLVRQGWSYAAKDRVVVQVARSLAILHLVRYSAEEIVEHLVSRSGILREPVEGQVDFVHRTFQEYLAGKAAADDDEIGLVVANADDNDWREVVLMTAAHARPRACEELVSGLLARHAALKTAGPSRFSFLLIRALGFAHYLPPELTRHIEGLALAMIPPKTNEAASDLEPMGELLVDLMASELPLAPDELGPSIFAVSLVGGPKALDLVGQMLADVDEVGAQLLRPWPYFAAPEFAEVVFPKLNAPGGVSVGEAKLYPHLHHLRRVRILNLEDDTLSLREATAPPHLQQLTVSRRARGTVDGIEHFSTAQQLTVNLTHTVPSLTPVAALAQLKKLVLNVRLPISARVDLSPLATLPHLTTVEVISDGTVHVDAAGLPARVTLTVPLPEGS